MRSAPDELDQLRPRLYAPARAPAPAAVVGDVGPGVLDLSLPTDQALLTAADPDPQQQYGLIRDARPDRIADTATRFAAAGQSTDTSARHPRQPS